MARVSVTVNGVAREAEVEPRTLLVYFLRETLGLTGTNVGCDTSSCGSCTVLLDGESVKSCTLLAVQAEGREVTTIEGLAPDGELHPLQEAFRGNHGLQCGFCTPGMIMAARELLRGEPEPDRGGDPRVPRGQPLPLHRLPEHREVDPRRRRDDVRREGIRGAEMATAQKYVGSRSFARKTRSSSPGRPSSSTTSTLPGMVWMAVVRSPYAHARIGRSTRRTPPAMPGVIAASSRPGPGGRVAAGRLPCAWPVTEDIKMPAHWPIAMDKARYAATPWRSSSPRRGPGRGRRRGRGRSTTSRSRSGRSTRRRREGRARAIHEDLGTNVVVHWTLTAAARTRRSSTRPRSW